MQGGKEWIQAQTRLRSHYRCRGYHHCEHTWDKEKSHPPLPACTTATVMIPFHSTEKHSSAAPCKQRLAHLLLRRGKAHEMKDVCALRLVTAKKLSANATHVMSRVIDLENILHCVARAHHLLCTSKPVPIRLVAHTALLVVVVERASAARCPFSLSKQTNAPHRASNTTPT